MTNVYAGNHAKAIRYLDSAWNYQFDPKWMYYNDPMLDDLRDRDDFKKIIERVDKHYDFRKRAFMNAVNRMGASNELRNLLK